VTCTVQLLSERRRRREQEQEQEQEGRRGRRSRRGRKVHSKQAMNELDAGRDRATPEGEEEEAEFIHKQQMNVGR
jgi:hypothetical protein